MASSSLRFISRSRSLLSKPSLFSRSFFTISTTTNYLSTLSLLRRLRPLAAVSVSIPGSFRSFATRQSQSSLNDNSPNWSNRPPKETILLDGCDFEHWLVVTEPPPEGATRDEIIDSYIKTLAQIVGSEDEARMKIYSVSTRCYFAFGALVSEELSLKLKELPNVRWVLPDSYLDVKNKDYGGEPFINGQAVPYDPKYHEEWIRNNQKAQDRNRRNDRPRNNDRSRNFDRRQRTSGFQNNPSAGGPPNMGGGPGGSPGGPPPNMGGPGGNPGGPPPNMGQPGGYGQNMPPNNAGYAQNNSGFGQNMPQNNPGFGQNNPGFGQNNLGFAHNAPNRGEMPPPNYGGQGYPGYQNNQAGGMPNYQDGGMPNFQGGGGYQNTQMPNQQNYAPHSQGNVGGQPGGGGGYQGQTVPGRDMPNYQ